MTRGQRVSEAIERSVSGPVWHGPALVDLVEDVAAPDAASHPIAGAHSIWELVLHVTAWAEIARQRLNSTSPVEATPEEDWPAVGETSADAWRTAIERLKDAHRALAAETAALDDARLISRVPGRDHAVIVMLHGIMEHDAYHGGQIAILKRALAER
ncbi:MAG TPA: DinB family protein [Gemmatimonadaceae bacterium]|nr:DinB family protein [Gemmatimonadaceae bacterium]